MLQRIAHVFGFGKKDEVLAKRFQQIKTRYSEGSAELDAARSELESTWAAGSAPQTMDELRRSLIDSYAKNAGVSEEGELVSASH